MRNLIQFDSAFALPGHTCSVCLCYHSGIAVHIELLSLALCWGVQSTMDSSCSSHGGVWWCTLELAVRSYSCIFVTIVLIAGTTRYVCIGAYGCILSYVM